MGTLDELFDKLRSVCGRNTDCANWDGCNYNNCWDHRAVVIDEIERELNERYVELPVDADGVPWHIGDEAIGVTVWEGERFTVGSIELMGDGAQLVDVETVDAIPCGAARHVQPDTWERIVEDAIHAGATEVNNDVRGNLIDRCRALAGEDE